MEPLAAHLKITRTARYYLLGDTSVPPKTILFVLHGYGMQAGLFLSEFENLVKPGVLIVAPEGLSRFYRKGFAGEVVASWMTREDRLFEIDDYVGYLDALLLAVAPEGKARTMVLGYSQGAATASRWLCMGKVRFSELILWCGEFAADAGNLPLKLPVVRHVYAYRDEFIPQERFARQSERLRDMGMEVYDYGFDGYHVIDPPTLKTVFSDAGM